MARYEGWANWETWQMNLHLSNEEADYRYWMKEATARFEDAGLTLKGAVGALAAQMEGELSAFLEQSAFEKLPAYARDLLIMDMREIDWEELADHWVRDAKENYVR